MVWYTNNRKGGLFMYKNSHSFNFEIVNILNVHRHRG